MRLLLDRVDHGHVRDVLELGCGMGTVSARLAADGKCVVGTDIDPGQIELARQTYPSVDRLRFEVEDASQLSFAERSFDLVIAQYVFHHIPGWRGAVREIARVLKSGGYLIWNDLTCTTLTRVLLAGLKRHFGVYSQLEVIDAFEQAGFRSVSSERLSCFLFCHHIVLFHLLWAVV